MRSKDKKLPVDKPKVTQLPIPMSETPLVIDLPDGQKLVIGKIAVGSVIEVATWRGTGRPDSRTSRLMLGMANGAVNTNSAESDTFTTDESHSATRKNSGRIHLVVKFLQRIARAIANLLRKVPWSKIWNLTIHAKYSALQKIKNKTNGKIDDSKPAERKKEFSTKNSEKLSDTPSSDEIEEWLNSVVAKSQKASERTRLKASQPAKPTKSTKSNSKSTKSNSKSTKGSKR
tara:strand:- start:3159 stop:3851 length:693 start_codon:yes stop_codon:yes gene_type:complete